MLESESRKVLCAVFYFELKKFNGNFFWRVIFPVFLNKCYFCINLQT